jgi:hypothetical protein
MQIEVIGQADLRNAFRNRAGALFGHRRLAIAGVMRMQMIVVRNHDRDLFTAFNLNFDALSTAKERY